MGNVVKVLGWVVAAVAIATAVFLLRQSAQLREQLTRAQVAVIEGESEPGRLPTIQEQLERALAQNETLSEELEEAQAEIERIEAAPQQADVPMPDFDLGLEETAEGEVGDGAEEEEEDSGGPDRQERIVQAQMGMMVDMAYATLFEELALPADIQADVRELLAKNLGMRQMATIKAIQSKDRKASELKAEDDIAVDQLRGELAQVLSAGEMEQWEDYRQYEDQYLYRALLDGQLNMLAPGLSAENREIATVVIAEEVAAHIDAFENSDETYTLGNFNQAQTAALRQSLDRLAGELDEEQYAHVEGFVTQAEAMFDAMAE